jgi:hypothetical protein
MLVAADGAVDVDHRHIATRMEQLNGAIVRDEDAASGAVGRKQLLWHTDVEISPAKLISGSTALAILAVDERCDSRRCGLRFCVLASQH